MVFEKNDFILFTGDSITDAGRKRPIGEGLWEGVGTGFVRTFDSIMQTFYPELMLRISNTGISGDTTRELKARWETDVLGLSPDWLVVCIGVNDVWRQFDEPNLGNHVSIDEYRNNLIEMLNSCKGRIKKGVMILSPYYMEPQKADFMRAQMDRYGAVCKELSITYGTHFVDLQAVFDEYLKYRHSSYITWDRIHPNGVGSMLIARAVLDGFGIEVSVK